MMVLRKLFSIWKLRIGFIKSIIHIMMSFQIQPKLGLDMDSVSIMTGHATKTAEMCCCRKRQEVTIRQAQALWNGKMSSPDSKPSNFESRFEVIGYV